MSQPRKALRSARPKPVIVKKPERILTDREKQQVRRMISDNIELKYHVPYLTTALSTSTPVITGMTDIVQGGIDTQRTGDRIKLCGTAELRLSVNADVATGDVTQTLAFVRFIMFQWHPTSDSGAGTKPTAANILLNGPSGTPDVYSFYNHDQRQNYAILYDEVFKPTGIVAGGAGAVSTNSNISHYAARKIPLAKNVRHQMQYQAASSTNSTNHLYMMTMSNLSSDAQNPSIIWAAKVFFRDA